LKRKEGGGTSEEARGQNLLGPDAFSKCAFPLQKDKQLGVDKLSRHDIHSTSEIDGGGTHPLPQRSGESTRGHYGETVKPHNLGGRIRFSAARDGDQ